MTSKQTSRKTAKQKTTTTVTDGQGAPALEDRQAVLVPLADLTLSPLNPRQSVTEAEIAAMAESLRTVGLMQNLAGLAGKRGKTEIVAGGRRLRALKDIAKADGTDPKTVMVPVILAKDEAEAQAWAGTENITRAALHPADEVRAYARMAETGAAPETIAKAFAVTVRHVKGRLRLASLPTPILDALRADAITLDTAAAYTVTDDADRALAVFESVSGTYMEDNAYGIRRKLMEEAVEPEDRLARFVGRAAYEAAGGSVREDLFGEEVYFLDANLLVQLADEKPAAAKAEIEAEGWRWVEAGYDRFDWQIGQKMGRTHPERVTPGSGEAERYDELAELIEKDVASEDEEAEFVALAAKLDQETYSETQRAHAGAYLWLNHRGELEVERGLVKPGDRKAAEKAGVCHATERPRAGKPERKGPYPAALAADLAKVRTGALQTALLGKPELALDLLTFSLATPLWADVQVLGIRTEAAPNAPETDDGVQLPERLQAREQPMPLNGQQAAEAFAAFRARPKRERNAILTAEVARIVRAGLAGETANPLAELVAHLAGLDVRAVWTRTASFLTRLRAGQLDAIMAHVAGEDGVPASFTKLKKAEKIARLHAIFAKEKGIPPLTPAQKARAMRSRALTGTVQRFANRLIPISGEYALPGVAGA